MAFLDKTGVERLWAHIISKLGEKVDMVEGKGLSTNDYTDEEKEKLANLTVGVGNVAIDDALSSSSTNPVQNNVIYLALDNKVDKVDGKGLSTNDYTTADKEKLANLETLVSELQTKVAELESILNSNNYLVAD